MNLADLLIRNAEKAPNAVAFRFGERTMTYSEAAAEGGRIAAGLRSLGVDSGDRVLMFGENSIEYLLVYHACARMGAVFAPVHSSFGTRELEYVSTNAGARVAFVHEGFIARYREVAAEVQLPSTVVVIPSMGSRSYEGPERSLDDIGLDEPPVDAADLEGSEPVLICYTSGSTSTPKPVLRSHRGESWNATVYSSEWAFDESTIGVVALPLSWVYGLSTVAQAMIAGGSELVLLPRFNPVKVLESIESRAATAVAGTSTMYVKMLDVLSRQAFDISSLRNCYIGGEPANLRAVREFESLVGTRIWEGYAATEAAPVLLTSPRTDRDAPQGTCGRLVSGAEIRLMGQDGAPVPKGEIGEAEFRCPGIMIGYFNEPELTTGRLTEDGWVRSGDLLREADGGYFFVVGRATDMIIRGGANIAPAEVENAITEHPGVVDATVVGVPDDEYGEQVVALIETKDSAAFDVDGLLRFLGQRLASYKVPVRVYQNVGGMDGPTGKRNRASLRAKAVELWRAPAADPQVPARTGIPGGGSTVGGDGL